MARTAAPTTSALSGDLRSGRMVAMGDEKYLWVLVSLEALTLLLLRQAFRRHHGG